MEESDMPLAENWCLTKYQVTKAKLEWKIQMPFEKFFSGCFTTESSRFSAKETPLLEWFLTFKRESPFPFHRVDVISIRLNSVTERQKEDAGVVDVIVQLALMNNFGEKNFITKDETGYYLMDVEPLVKLDDCIVDETLTVYCEIEQIHKETVSGNASGTTSAPVRGPFIGGDQLLRSQLETLFETMLLSDVCFEVRDRQFKAHKSILASRSPVFAAMFEHPTKEKLTNRVVIEDIQPDVFQELLRFIYTGRLTSASMEAMASELLAAANKYLLDQLKIECENHLVYRISAENCLDILLLEDENHPAYYLRKEAAKFFRLRPDKVMASGRWIEAKQKNPALLCDIQEFVFRPDK